MCDYKKIVLLSDGTGQTAKRLMDAVLAQYDHEDVEYSLEDTFQNVRDKKSFDNILDKINDDYLVIFSIISENLSKYIHNKLHDRNILHLNVLQPMITTMSKFLGVHPEYQPGKLHIIDDRYYKKVDAIGYTVEHDDGRGAYIQEADIVLIGPSRTCKTPISMFLACNHGMKVANIPIINDSSFEKYLFSRLKTLNQKRIFCLTMQSEVLAKVREERSFHLAHNETGHSDLDKYIDIHEISLELQFCRSLYSKGSWQVVDVTRRAIEEISREILEHLGILD